MLHRTLRPALAAISFAFLFVACHTKFDPKSAPFTLDSLVTYNHASLVALAGEEQLKDSVITAEGKKLSATVFMRNTNLEAEIVWTDSARKFMDHVTIRKNALGQSWWKTRDSITIGSTRKQVEEANGQRFYFLDSGALYSFGEGNLAGRIHDLKMKVRIAGSGHLANHLYTSGETNWFSSEPTVVELTVNRDALPSPLVVQTLTVKGPNGKDSKVPYLADRTGAGSKGMEMINQQLKNTFGLTSFDPAKINKFTWDNVTFDYEKDQRMIAFRIRGIRDGVEHDELYYYRLISGESVPLPDFPFASFFKYDAYYTFVDQFWWHPAAAKLNAFAECSGSEMYCQPDENFKTSAKGKDLILTLNQTCFSGAKPKCVPGLDVTLPIGLLTPSLNEFGTKLVVDNNYFGSLLGRFKSSYALLQEVPVLLFVRYSRGEAEGVPLPDGRLAILFDKSNDFTGTLKASQSADPWPEGFQVPEFLDDRIGDDAGPAAPITGSFTYSGFRLISKDWSEPLQFSWSESDEEGGFQIGSRWLAFSGHQIVSVIATNPDAFHESRLAEEDNEGD